MLFGVRLDRETHVARETLGLLKGLATPEIFRQITFENGAKLFKVPA